MRRNKNKIRLKFNLQRMFILSIFGLVILIIALLGGEVTPKIEHKSIELKIK